MVCQSRLTDRRNAGSPAAAWHHQPVNQALRHSAEALPSPTAAGEGFGEPSVSLLAHNAAVTPCHQGKEASGCSARLCPRLHEGQPVDRRRRDPLQDQAAWLEQEQPAYLVAALGRPRSSQWRALALEIDRLRVHPGGADRLPLPGVRGKDPAVPARPGRVHRRQRLHQRRHRRAAGRLPVPPALPGRRQPDLPELHAGTSVRQGLPRGHRCRWAADRGGRCRGLPGDHRPVPPTPAPARRPHRRRGRPDPTRGACRQPCQPH
jgi:hypothetical protein